MDHFSIKTVVTCVFAATLLQACTLTVSTERPVVSEQAWSHRPTDDSGLAKVHFVGALADSHEVSVSKLPMVVHLDGKPIDAAAFVEQHLVSELQARNAGVTFTSNSKDQFLLHDLEIISHRVSGFSPMVTLSMAQADLIVAGQSQRLVSFVKRAKVPVWSMDEINEPAYNEPLELVIKELAAKVNQNYHNRSLPDTEVEALIEEIRAFNSGNGSIYLTMYELAFSNNELAKPFMVEMTSHPAEYIRLAAISGLGILRAKDQFDHLVSLYQNSDIWQDRAMALKAIGDLGTEKSHAFLLKQRDRWQNATSNEGIWNSRILSLYLDDSGN